MLILFYKKIIRTRFGIYEQLQMDRIHSILPEGIEITYDRSRLNEVDAVVFNLPFLLQDLEDDIEKRDGQVWVGWSYESEANYPWIFSDEMKDLMDIFMTYHLSSDIVLPYFDYTFKEKLLTPPCTPYNKKKEICMFVSSPVNQSKRVEYLSGLMGELDIDSYGRLFNNSHVQNDTGYESKVEVIKDYKFTIAFENAVSEDYVTEKFFDPLIMGSVPIYLGAPNIDIFSPGNQSFIKVADYKTPKDLAIEIKRIGESQDLYDSFFNWKKSPILSPLSTLVEAQKTHPFIRLAEKINYLRLKRN